MVERPRATISIALDDGLPAKAIDHDGELSHALFGLARAENGLNRPATQCLWLAPSAGEGEPTRMAETLLSLHVNGEAVHVAAPAHWSLLEVLRYRLDLIGSKQGCDKGDCGACTVQIDGEPVLACLTLACTAQGRPIRTVEGLGWEPQYRAAGCHPLQDAMDRYDAAQCGFCTPGILMSAESLLRKRGRPVTPIEVREALAGNLCRCTGYTKIVDAVVDASEQMFAPATAPSESGHEHG